MTVFVFVVSPVIFYWIISFCKYCVSRHYMYKEMKYLRDSGVKHAVVAEDYIKY